MKNTEQAILAGRRLTYDQAVELYENSSVEELCALADRLRREFRGRALDTCSIINARSGRCPEDCKWCSQSKFHKTDIAIYPLVDTDTVLGTALRNESGGVRRFSLVTSGRTVEGKDFERICATYRELSQRTGLKLCASLGLLSADQMRALKECGVERYHCNLESAPSFFPSLCTTHTTWDKIQTLRRAREAGLDLCSGGIIGMGESAAQRIELAVVLRDEGVRSVPVNILNPIEGTRLAGIAPLSDDEILASVAMLRIVNPEADIRLAGGRVRVPHLSEKMLHCGASAAIVGDMLTTPGSSVASDMDMFNQAGFDTAI